MNNKAFDDAFEMILSEAASIADENIGKNLNDPETKHVFSEEHNKKMEKLFRKERRKAFIRNVSKYSKSAACVALVLLCISGISIFSVDAWRKVVIEFVFDKDAPNTDFNFVPQDGTSYKDDDIYLEYIPTGFELTHHESENGRIGLTFVSEESIKKSFSVTIGLLTDNINYDTEDAEITNIKVNKYDAIQIIKDRVSFIIWTDNYRVYYVQGSLPIETLHRIAEGIIL